MPSLQQKASRRLSSARIRLKAPKHPPGPEANIRLAIARLFNAYHANIRDTVVRYAPRFLQHEQRQTLSVKSDSMMQSVLAELREHGHNMLKHGVFKHDVRTASEKTADSASTQVANAIDIDPDAFEVDLSGETDMLADGIYDNSFDRMDDSIERASQVLGQWANLEEPDVDDLGAKLDDGLQGVLGSALAGASLLFGYAFAGMNKEAQDQAGVEQYVWVSQNDGRVRPEHRALDGETFDADEQPLSAEDSDSGDDCGPGDDFNCRCVAAPVPPDATDDDQDLLN